VKRDPADPGQSAEVLNQRDEQFTTTAVSLPLYQLPQVLAVVGGYVNIRSNPRGSLAYNCAEWGPHS
jgi:hypothetical protein